eukprot:3803129-Heterocapsa_arctica.AAC.1
MAKRWIKTNAHIWDGMEKICWYGSDDFLHHHQPKGANGQEPTAIRCTQQEENTFWERLRDATEERAEEGEATAAGIIEGLRAEASA